MTPIMVSSVSRSGRGPGAESTDRRAVASDDCGCAGVGSEGLDGVHADAPVLVQHLERIGGLADQTARVVLRRDPVDLGGGQAVVRGAQVREVAVPLGPVEVVRAADELVDAALELA